MHTNQFRARASLRIADNRTRTHHWRTPIKSPGGTTRRDATCQLGGHIGRGDSARSHDDADSGAKVEYRTSSTPAYTDGLDLHYSTNNAPTTTQVRSTLRIADNTGNTNNGCLPTDNVAGGLVKVNAAVFPTGQTAAENGWTVNVCESCPHETPHCGQLLVYQLWGRSTKLRFRTRLRIADNTWCTNNGEHP